MNLTIRTPILDDIEPCGRITYEAFKQINEAHGFPNLEVPTEEDGYKMVKFWIKNNRFWGRVAELDGRIVGSTFIDERSSEVSGWAIISFSLDAQGKGIGRRFMEESKERCKDIPGRRFLQHTFNTSAMGLYTSFGFDVKELIVLISGKPKSQIVPGVEVRRMKIADLEECGKLCKRVYGFDRNQELRDAIIIFTPFVAVRNGSIIAYISAADNWAQNHGVAESEESMKILIQGISSLVPDQLTFLVPGKQSSLLRWFLKERFRIIKPFTLMSMGMYNDPVGTYFTSIVY
jgi:GNAT superfamily N-acetyltransferase